MLETSAERDTRRVSERDDNTRTELSSRHMYIGCPERLRRLNTSGPLSRRWRGAGGKHAAPPLLRAACAAPCRAVFHIYRYDTGIWGFIDSFRVVLVCGMRKWYTNFIDSCSGQPLEVHRKSEA